MTGEEKFVFDLEAYLGIKIVLTPENLAGLIPIRPERVIKFVV